MFRYCISRLVSVLPTLLGVSVVAFVLLQLVPGDPAVTYLGPDATPAQLAAARHDLGLDQVLPVRYGMWLGHTLSGDLGTSYQQHSPVASLVGAAAMNSAWLMLASLSLSIVFGVGCGVAVSGAKPRMHRQLTMQLLVGVSAIPVFCVALLLLWIFAIELRWLPTTGMFDPRGDQSTSDFLLHLILPAVATSLVSAAVVARQTQSSMRDVANKDFVRTFVAFGASSRRVALRHVLRNAAAPVINMIGMQIGFLMGGALFTEMIFSWPGLGQLLYAGIASKDYPVVIACTLVIAIVALTANCLVDIINAFLTPSLRTKVGQNA